MLIAFQPLSLAIKPQGIAQLAYLCPYVYNYNTIYSLNYFCSTIMKEYKINNLQNLRSYINTSGYCQIKTIYKEVM